MAKVMIGIGQFSNPMYRSIVIVGSGTVHSGVQAEKMISYGQTSFSESCIVGVNKQYGLVSIGGEIKGDRLLCRGKIQANGRIEYGHIKLYGKGELTFIQANQIKLNGEYKVNGGITCDSLSASGCLHSFGEIEAKSVAMNFNQSGYIEHISADSIAITVRDNYVIKKIIGNVVNLHNVTSEEVYGEVVSVTGQSDIAKVHYSTQLHVAEESSVSHRSRTPKSLFYK